MITELDAARMHSDACCTLIAVPRTGKIVWASKIIEDLFGYVTGEMLTKDFRVENLMPDDLRTSHVGLRGSYERDPSILVMGNGRPVTVQKKDGTTFKAVIGIGRKYIDDVLHALITVLRIQE